MKTTTTFFLAGSVLSGALALVACSSNGGDNSMGDAGSKPDGTVKDTGTSTDTGTNGEGGGDGGTVDCGTTATLHPSDGGIYCPFSGIDGGANLYCTSNVQHCCEPAMGTSSCKPIATSCATTDTDWQCEDKSDCAGNTVCCGIGKPGGPDPGCVNLFATAFKGTHCAQTCAAMEFVVCESDSQCANGMTCKAAKIKGNQVGICQ